MSSRRVVAVSVSVLAALYAAAFLVCVAARLTFGFELAWLESGMQAMTARLAAHQSIYAAPSTSYVPFIYPPLYYVASHGLERVAPALAGAPAMRVVSLASTLATLAVLWFCLARRGASGRLRLVLGALYLSFYGRFEFWHDTSRVDSLFVLLFFTAAALLIEGRRLRSAIAGGALAGLAILTKQPALPLLLGCVAVVAYTTRDPARVLAMLVAASLGAIGGLAAMGELHNPWLYYYVVQVPATHALLARNLYKGVAFVAGTMPLFIASAVLTLRAHRRAGTAATTTAVTTECVSWRWTLVFAVSTAVMLALRLKAGASLNFFLPLVPLGIVVAAPVLSRLGTRAEPVLLGQLLLLLYNPLTAIPTAQDWRAGFELLGSLRAVDGDVFLPQFPSYLSQTGKAPVAHAVAVCDLAALRPDLMRAIVDQLDEGRFAAAISWPGDQARERCHPALASPHFHNIGTPPAGGAFFSTGHLTKLGSIYRYDPRETARGDGDS
jgi:hypothetical protein